MLKQTLKNNGKSQPEPSSVFLASAHNQLDTKIVDVYIYPCILVFGSLEMVINRAMLLSLWEKVVLFSVSCLSDVQATA